MLLKIKKIIIFCTSFLIIDLIFSYFFFNLIFLNLEKIHYADLNNRIFDKEYKYTFKPNISFVSIYNDFIYTIHTNNFGFRDKKNRDIKNNKEVFFFIGDSFMEGVGLNFEDTLLGHLDQNRYTYLNSGVTSYSTYLYKKKTISFLEENKDFKIKRVILLFDKSDPLDDQKYISMYNSEKKNQQPEFFINEKNLLPPYKKKLSERSITLAFLKLFTNFIEELQRDIKYRYIISKKYDTKFLNLGQNQITAMKSIGNVTYMSKYYTNNSIWENKMKLYILDSFKNLKDLETYLSKKNIKLDIFLFPWPFELVFDDTRNKYLNYIKDINKNYNMTIHSCYDYFLEDNILDQLETIGRSFLLGDVHYNSYGYKTLANCIKNKL